MHVILYLLFFLAIIFINEVKDDFMAHVTNFSFCDNRENKFLKCSSYSSNIPNSLVRIVIFKECRVKERQLLFDSNMSEETEISKIQLWKLPWNKFSEEYNRLSELIFGSTAMRFHGTYHKIHSMSSSRNLMITQVFPTPSQRKLNKSDTVIKLNKSVIGSYNSEREDPLFEKHGSISSESSISIFRKCESDRSNTISTIDSGFAEQSLSSIPTLDSQFSFSGSDYSSVMSLKDRSRVPSYQSDSSDSLLTSSFSSQTYLKTRSNYSRIGLAIVVAPPEEQNVYIQFYMYYAYFIENILYRICRSLQLALYSFGHFLTVMKNITKEANCFINDLLKYINSGDNANAEVYPMDTKVMNFSFIKKIVYQKWMKINKRNISIFQTNQKDQEIKIWCRPLEMMENKAKNFFISSLLTAVLTVHPGWISTCYEVNSVKQNVFSRNSYNALWYQLLDYCGSFGPNHKTSKVVLHSSTNTDDVMKDIVRFLRYFIRYFRVQRRETERENITEENEQVNLILNKEKGRKLSYCTNELSCFVSQAPKSALTRKKTLSTNLAKLGSLEDCLESVEENDPVIFILGDNEKLINLKEDSNFDELKTSNRLDISFGKNLQENFSNQRPITVLPECHEDGSKEDQKLKMNVITFPLPGEKVTSFVDINPYECSLNKKSFEKIAHECVLQSFSSPEKQWQDRLKSDLSLYTCATEGNIQEVVTVLGKTDDWKVQILSSKKSMGNNLPSDSVEFSQLVADIFEILQEMEKICIPKQYCLTHIEQRLLEICLRSHALANLLASTDFCTMDNLLSSLQIDVSDVPLLMSTASTLCPEITKRYGISYQ